MTSARPISVRPTVFCFLGEGAEILWEELPRRIESRLGEVPAVLAFARAERGWGERIGGETSRSSEGTISAQETTIPLEADLPGAALAERLERLARVVAARAREREPGSESTAGGGEPWRAARGAPEIFLIQRVPGARGLSRLLSCIENVRRRRAGWAAPFPVHALLLLDVGENGERALGRRDLRWIEIAAERALLDHALVAARAAASVVPAAEAEREDARLIELLVLLCDADLRRRLWSVEASRSGRSRDLAERGGIAGSGSQAVLGTGLGAGRLSVLGWSLFRPESTRLAAALRRRWLEEFDRLLGAGDGCVTEADGREARELVPRLLATLSVSAAEPTEASRAALVGWSRGGKEVSAASGLRGFGALEPELSRLEEAVAERVESSSSRIRELESWLREAGRRAARGSIPLRINRPFFLLVLVIWLFALLGMGATGDIPPLSLLAGLAVLLLATLFVGFISAGPRRPSRSGATAAARRGRGRGRRPSRREIAEARELLAEARDVLARARRDEERLARVRGAVRSFEKGVETLRGQVRAALSRSGPAPSWPDPEGVERVFAGLGGAGGVARVVGEILPSLGAGIGPAAEGLAVSIEARARQWAANAVERADIGEILDSGCGEASALREHLGRQALPLWPRRHGEDALLWRFGGELDRLSAAGDLVCSGAAEAACLRLRAGVSSSDLRPPNGTA